MEARPHRFAEKSRQTYFQNSLLITPDRSPCGLRADAIDGDDDIATASSDPEVAGCSPVNLEFLVVITRRLALLRTHAGDAPRDKFRSLCPCHFLPLIAFNSALRAAAFVSAAQRLAPIILVIAIAQRAYIARTAYEPFGYPSRPGLVASCGSVTVMHKHHSTGGLRSGGGGASQLSCSVDNASTSRVVDGKYENPASPPLEKRIDED